ncbi:MAG: carboxypeptidase-like regulatory domain-containing protein, partial [Flammeovirgaceae bacterium]
MRFLASLLILFVWVSSQLHGQEAIVKGFVKDQATGMAISGAEIFIRGIPSSTKSKSAGDFLLTNVPFGVVEIQVRKEGYQKITLKANIQSFNNGLDVALARNKSLDIPEPSSQLNKYREKVVLVTDKPYYYPGEIIWL